MVASARAAYMARRAGDYGVHTGPVTVDLAAVRQRKRDIVASWSAGQAKRIEDAPNTELIWGWARFTAPHTIEVALNAGGTRLLSADQVFINTGARPFVPPLDGLTDVPFLDSTSIMELGDVPEHLLILGGGYISLEFGQMFRRFGSAVTIVERGGQIAGREDPDIAETLADILREDGIDILLNTSARRVDQDAAGTIALAVSGPDGERTLHGSHLLVAVGRTPNTDALGLDLAGVDTDARGYVKTNARLETSVAGVYAIGDVKGGPAFTHISYDDFRILRDNLLHDGPHSAAPRTIADRQVPFVLYTDPQLGRVGLTEREAQDQGIAYKLAKMPMNYVARALETDEARGLMKALVDPASGQILGAAVLGMEGGEVMAILQVAMLGGLPYTALKEGVFAHPSLAESLNNLFGSLE